MLTVGPFLLLLAFAYPVSALLVWAVKKMTAVSQAGQAEFQLTAPSTRVRYWILTFMALVYLSGAGLLMGFGSVCVDEVRQSWECASEDNYVTGLTAATSGVTDDQCKSLEQAYSATVGDSSIAPTKFPTKAPSVARRRLQELKTGLLEFQTGVDFFASKAKLNSSGVSAILTVINTNPDSEEAFAAAAERAFTTAVNKVQGTIDDKVFVGVDKPAFPTTGLCVITDPANLQCIGDITLVDSIVQTATVGQLDFKSRVEFPVGLPAVTGHVTEKFIAVLDHKDFQSAFAENLAGELARMPAFDDATLGAAVSTQKVTGFAVDVGETKGAVPEWDSSAPTATPTSYPTYKPPTYKELALGIIQPSGYSYRGATNSDGYPTAQWRWKFTGGSNGDFQGCRYKGKECSCCRQKVFLYGDDDNNPHPEYSADRTTVSWGGDARYDGFPLQRTYLQTDGRLAEEQLFGGICHLATLSHSAKSTQLL